MSQVNNAGATQLKTIPDLKSEDLHVKGPFNITQRALPAITKSKGEGFYQHHMSPMNINLTILTIIFSCFTL